MSSNGNHHSHSWPTRVVGAVVLISVLGVTSAQAQTADRIAETCHGSEIITTVGKGPTCKPFAVDFSADLKGGYVCYGDCKPAQTFSIKTGQTNNPIVLSDVNSPSQSRSITFDRRTSTLVDHQVINLLVNIKREAVASCRPMAYRQPAIARVRS